MLRVPILRLLFAVKNRLFHGFDRLNYTLLILTKARAFITDSLHDLETFAKALRQLLLRSVKHGFSCLRRRLFSLFLLFFLFLFLVLLVKLL